MSNIIDPVGSVSTTYDGVTPSQSNQNSGSGFSDIFNEALNEQIRQSLLTNMPGFGGSNGFNGFGGSGDSGGFGGLGGIG